MTSTAAARGKAPKSQVARYQMYIDGKFVDAQGGKTFDVFDPATEEVIATCPAGDAKDVDLAAQVAKKAFYDGWKAVTAQERGRILLRLAERIRARRAELAELETRNTGKPIAASEAVWPPRSTVRCSPSQQRQWPLPCGSRWVSPGKSSPGTIR